MFLGELEDLTLLLSEGEGNEGSLVAVSDVEAGEETLDMGKLKRRGGPPIERASASAPARANP
jgi:hypothetical protein